MWYGYWNRHVYRKRESDFDRPIHLAFSYIHSASIAFQRLTTKKSMTFKSMTTRKTVRKTDGQTDRRLTKWSPCAAMLRSRYKKSFNSTLNNFTKTPLKIYYITFFIRLIFIPRFFYLTDCSANTKMRFCWGWFFWKVCSDSILRIRTYVKWIRYYSFWKLHQNCNIQRNQGKPYDF